MWTNYFFCLCFCFFLQILFNIGALYCLCKDGVDDQALQKAIENACWFGADCASIEPNGACYTPNTLKDHCNYVVNSYYQRMRNAGGTCDFAGVATTSSTPPCKYYVYIATTNCWHILLNSTMTNFLLLCQYLFYL